MHKKNKGHFLISTFVDNNFAMEFSNMLLRFDYSSHKVNEQTCSEQQSDYKNMHAAYNISYLEFPFFLNHTRYAPAIMINTKTINPITPTMIPAIAPPANSLELVPLVTLSITKI